MWFPVFQQILMAYADPQKNPAARAWLEARIHRGIYPSEIQNNLDMLIAGLVDWAKKQSDPPQSYYTLIRKIVNDEFDEQDRVRIYNQYLAQRKVEPEKAKQTINQLSSLDRGMLYVGLRPAGLPNTTEAKAGLLFHALNLTPNHSFIKALEHGNS